MSKKAINPMAKLIQTDDSDKTIYEKYLDHMAHYSAQYGPKTIVLMMVGSFYEIYGLRCDSNVHPLRCERTLHHDKHDSALNPLRCDSVLSDSTTNKTDYFLNIIKLCQLNYSEKKKANVNGQQVLMAGFPEYTLEKYLQILSDAGYTSVVIVQDEENSVKGGKKKHMIHSIYSPGTYIPATIGNTSEKTQSNNIMCVLLQAYRPMHKVKSNIIIGVSLLNMFTGKSMMSERVLPFENNATTFDDLERLVSVYNPCEVIILYDFEALQLNTSAEQLVSQIRVYTGINCECVHTHNIVAANANTNANANSIANQIKNCEKQVYQEQIINSVFGADSLSVCEEYTRFPTATKSLCFLLNFIKEHNPALIRKVVAPEFTSEGTQVLLANHALKQLNMIDDHSSDSVRSGRLSSVLTFLNKACTVSGRRRVKELVTAPTYDEEVLTAVYDEVAEMMEHFGHLQYIRSQFMHVMDMEKVLRQVIVRKVQPLSVLNLRESLLCVRNVAANSVAEQFKVAESGEIIEKLDCVLRQIDAWIQWDRIVPDPAETYVCGSFICEGMDAEMDKLVADFNATKAHIEAIKSLLNMIMRTTSSNSANDDTDYVKINTTEKSGSSFQITKTRGKMLKSLIETGTYKNMPWYKAPTGPTLPKGVEMPEASTLPKEANASALTRQNAQGPLNTYHGYTIDLSDFKLKSATTSNDEIVFAQLTTLCAKMHRLENAISDKNTILYNKFVIDVLDTSCYSMLETIVKYVVDVDVLQCRAYVAKQYNYCRPTIVFEKDHGYVKATGLRHVLIEHIQQNELYVTNDVELDGGGFLLYGTNAVGKTSLIRAIGIATLLAQSGFYVPCTEFVYKPYKSFYTRILGSDNLYKGLSTFGVEMSELRMILKNADEWSMVLGDELCSGTETQSALSIFVAGLMNLHEKESSFIFATHFHEIVNYDEITALTRMQLKHMSVFYDRETDCLVYDRLLRDGPGDSMYGLEVCKSLHLPQEFLDQAFQLRTKYFPESAGDLSHKVSRYNTGKIVGKCELCGNAMGTEVHHLNAQREANASGYVGTAHKNHRGNLLTVCESCHQEMHSVNSTAISSLSDESETKVMYNTAKKVVKKKTAAGNKAYVIK